MMSNEELKPCPFCGSKAKYYKNFNAGYYEITCSECDYCLMSGDDIEEVVETWNTRPIEDELRQELEEVKFALQVEENDNEYNCAEKDRLKEENERLRRALTMIANNCSNAPYIARSILNENK